jgi:hypothetical protein
MVVGLCWFVAYPYNANVQHPFLSKFHDQLVKRIVLVQHLLIFLIRAFLMTRLTHHHMRGISLVYGNDSVHIKPLHQQGKKKNRGGEKKAGLKDD